MRTSIDVLRSVKRYVAEALGEDWEVRLLVEEGTFGRPAAQVLEATGQTITGPSHTMDVIQTFVVHAFPVKGDTVMESLLEASAVEDTFVRALRIGIGEGRAARIPLYDYEGVPHDAGSTARAPQDYARILDLEISRTQSPQDELLFTVSAEVRLGWRRDGQIPSSGRVAQEIRTTQETT